MLAWEDGYRIGIDEMDAQHLILFAILNQIDININSDMAQECVADALGALTSYIEYHFAHEEALLRKWQFPGFDEHKQRHKEFVDEVERLYDEAGKGDFTKSALQLRSTVLQWLLNHILCEDLEYANYIKAKR